MIFNNKQPVMPVPVQMPMIPQETTSIEPDEVQKWQMEVENLIDKKCNEIQGKVLDRDSGEWVIHPEKDKMVNEVGASVFKQYITSRVSINMQMSNLSNDDINRIVRIMGKDFSDQLADSWAEWEMLPLESNFNGLASQLTDMVFILLKIAQDQGMRKHLENRGMSRTISQPLPERGDVL